MTIRGDQEAKIRRMFYADHLSINAIAEQMSVHPSVVQRVIRTGRTPKGCDRASILEPYAALMQEKLEAYPKIRATSLYRLMRDLGYQGSVITVRRRLRKLRPTIKRAFVRVETLPGEEAQVDWAHLGKITIGEAERKVYLFAMVLSWSRGLYFRLCYDMSVETFLRSHTLAFEAFGGVPRRMIYDNMKTVVIDRKEKWIRFQDSFQEYAGYYCFEPRVCDPYQPNQKGKVERAIRYFRSSFLDGRSLKEVHQAEIDRWLQEVGLLRPWPKDQSRTVEACLMEEKKNLRELPSRLWPKNEKILRSDKTAWVRYDLNFYAIPPAHVRKPLTLHSDDHEIMIYDQGHLIARHERSWDRNRRIGGEELHKYEKKSGQYFTIRRHHIEQRFPEVRQLFEACLKLDISSYSLQKTLQRIFDDYGADQFSQVIKLAIEKDTPRPESLMQIAYRLIDQQKPQAIAIKLPDRPGVSDLSIPSRDLCHYDEL